MDKEEGGRLRQKLANLSSLKDQLRDQERLLRELQERSQAWEGAPDSVMNVLRRLFSEISDALPEKRLAFDDSNNIDGLRSQLSSVRSKVYDGIAAIYESLGETAPQEKSIIAPRVDQLSQATDKRRVFVVHGRNIPARDALFRFLRAINLDPIEWEEAVAMTETGAPYLGNVLDLAFSKAQAAVVLITGDDMARLGTRYLMDSDSTEERYLTPQARPNVLFEAGMAFGSHPKRTIIVSLGATRAFSDIVGRNIIYLSNNPDCRSKLAGRLKTAGCDVRIDNKQDWLREGDFDSTNHSADVKHVPAAASSTAPPDSRPIQETINERRELTVVSPDKYSVKIQQHEGDHLRGFIIVISNDSLSWIRRCRITIYSAQSFNAALNDYRDATGFNAIVIQKPEPVEGSHSSKSTWLVRGDGRMPHMLIGESQTELKWPPNDHNLTQKWLFSIGIDAETVPSPPTAPPKPLQSIKFKAVVIWNKANNEFSIEQA